MRWPTVSDGVSPGDATIHPAAAAASLQTLIIRSADPRTWAGLFGGPPCIAQISGQPFAGVYPGGSWTSTGTTGPPGTATENSCIGIAPLSGGNVA